MDAASRSASSALAEPSVQARILLNMARLLKPAQHPVNRAAFRQMLDGEQHFPFHDEMRGFKQAVLIERAQKTWCPVTATSRDQPGCVVIEGTQMKGPCAGLG